ncbi:MAG: ribonuclease P protein component [Candidatus Cloacimonetes bacterium]|nr:ribonuclease P protein component [Candidatus Cloacimonadota bacterium]
MKFIKSADDFRQIYRKNTRIEGKFFALLVSLSLPKAESTIGVVASKKIGKAVVRNRVKRRVKSFLRENWQIIPERCALVIISLETAGAASWQEITEDLANLINRIDHR